jgi:hypothetical protein
MSLAGPRVKPCGATSAGDRLVNPGEKPEVKLTGARGNAKTMIHGAGE